MRCVWVLLFFTIATAGTLVAEGAKFPVPSGSELEEPYKIIQEVFGDQLGAAKDAQAKSDLAMKLLTISTTTEDRCEKYAVIQLAQELALEAADMPLYFRVLESLGNDFQIDPVKLWAKAIMQQTQGQVDEATARQLAEADFAASSVGAKRIDAADAWYDLATNLKGSAAQAAKDQAVVHYRAAMPALKGLAKLMAQKRLQECQEGKVAPRVKATMHSPSKSTTKRYGRGRIVEVDCTKGLSARDAQKAQRSAAKAYGVPMEIQNKVGMSFRFIPAGSFLMGSPENEVGRKKREKQHLVKITKPFYCGMTEVTQAQYWKVTGANPSRFEDKPRNPVERVSWGDANSFCVALSKLDGERTYRLPTEAEWEYACRAGTLVARYGPLEKIAWTKKESSDKTMPVGLLAPNVWGLYDCLGNVHEWCQDYYHEWYYQNSPLTDPVSTAASGERVHRGGSIHWNDTSWRLASRGHYWGRGKEYNLGFRVVVTIDEE